MAEYEDHEEEYIRSMQTTWIREINRRWTHLTFVHQTTYKNVYKVQMKIFYDEGIILIDIHGNFIWTYKEIEDIIDQNQFLMRFNWRL